jgi:hypothetical protein
MAVATAPATFIVAADHGDTTWRSAWPAAAIGARRAEIPKPQLERALLGPNTDTPFPWAVLATTDKGETALVGDGEQWRLFSAGRPRLTRLELRFPELEGAALFVRPCLARATLAKVMRAQGTLTIAETDDNYFAPKRQNLVLRAQAEGEKAFDLHAKAMASMDRNVFSTEWLRDRYLREYRRRFGEVGLPEPFVARNCVPASAWPELEEYDGPLRVGFMGSASHVWDVHIAYAAFHAAKHLKATTTMIGYSPADPDPGVDETLRTRDSLAVSRKWAKVIDRHIHWTDPSVYHRRQLPLDIGVAPLRKGEFNHGKSDSKALEFTISGAACVLMRHPVFERAGWKHEENCLLASTQSDMGIQTLRLLRDPVLRRDLVAAAREMVANERNDEVMRTEWLAAVST